MSHQAEARGPESGGGHNTKAAAGRWTGPPLTFGRGYAGIERAPRLALVHAAQEPDQRQKRQRDAQHPQQQITSHVQLLRPQMLRGGNSEKRRSVPRKRAPNAPEPTASLAVACVGRDRSRTPHGGAETDFFGQSPIFFFQPRSAAPRACALSLTNALNGARGKVKFRFPLSVAFERLTHGLEGS